MTWDPTWDELRQIRAHINGILIERGEEPADRLAFSNGTEGDCWLETWCETCLYDLPARLEDPANGCPLILQAYNQQTPAAWYEAKPGSLRNRYRCALWRPESDGPLPVAAEPPPGQDVLFEGGA